MAYPTLAEVKTWLSITTATDDAVVTDCLDAAKNWVEQDTGRVFVAASATYNFKVGQPHVNLSRTQLNLFQDLVAVTSITNGDGVAVTVGQYDFWPVRPPYYRIDLRPSSGVRWQSANDTPVAINGSWGYSAACPGAIFEAVVEIAGLLYRARSSGGLTTMVNRAGVMQQGLEMPKHIQAVLRSFRRYSG